MDDLHNAYEMICETMLDDLTLEEVARLAGMILKESNFTLNTRWLESFLEELDHEQYTALLEHLIKKGLLHYGVPEA